MCYSTSKSFVSLLCAAVLSSGSISASLLYQDSVTADDRLESSKSGHSSAPQCSIDWSQPPQMDELVKCPNSSMFQVWRTKARVTGPRGWMNDPMAVFETRNGTYHIGYQCNPSSNVWSNISQCSASTSDFVHFNDYHSWKNPVTIAPSQLYDIRGVFDGTVIKNGWDGNPTIIYTSVFTGPISARSNPPEIEGVETQSLAYTEDDGSSWTKLNFGADGNPVIYKWPEQHLSGFRDPFVFESEELYQFYANQSIVHRIPGGHNSPKPRGKKYLLLSGGIRTESDPVHGGPRLFLYQQTKEHDLRDWTYLGPMISYTAERNQTSEWRGANGINFECGAITKIDEHGLANQKDATHSTTQLNVITVGTEGGRGQKNYWPIWKAVSWDFSAPDGNVKANADFSGVIDWGTAYAFHMFQSKGRQLIVGWIYEDDPSNVLTAQRGAQGAFTLFRELFVKVVRNIHPAELASQASAPSWAMRPELDGSHSLVTVGQRILPEITSAFRKKSSIFQFPSRTVSPGSNLNSSEGELASNVIPLDKKPSDRYYAITARLDFYAKGIPSDGDEFIDRMSMPRAGFRLLASKNEWTDIFYDPSEEYLVVDRSHSSVISSYGNSTERAKFRLWSILDPVTRETRIESLNLTIIVDNSVLEVHANERAIISTRVYPWYKNSTGIAYLAQGRPTIVEEIHPARSPPFSAHKNRINFPEQVDFQPLSVRFSGVEVWDGLVNAWPNRPRDTSLPGVYSHNITSTLYGLWPDS
uniref:Invertase 1 n=1 Tax=Uromyces fabae TaxID=55588 RepID=Q2PCS4_UROFA|nr:invertase 1 precursor [Uromyces viciae-fabae]